MHTCACASGAAASANDVGGGSPVSKLGRLLEQPACPIAVESITVSAPRRPSRRIDRSIAGEGFAFIENADVDGAKILVSAAIDAFVHRFPAILLCLPVLGCVNGDVDLGEDDGGSSE